MLASNPNTDHARQQPEHHVQHEHGDVVAEADTAVLATATQLTVMIRPPIRLNIDRSLPAHHAQPYRNLWLARGKIKGRRIVTPHGAKQRVETPGPDAAPAKQLLAQKPAL